MIPYCRILPLLAAALLALASQAGAARAGAFFELSDKDFLDAWQLKLLGYIRMVRAIVPHMAARQDGRIVNIIGAAGRTPPSTFLAGSTTNAALINFTRGISRELAHDNIRINAISPGSTATLSKARSSFTGRSTFEPSKPT